MVDIIIAAYNAPEKLKRCVSSVNRFTPFDHLITVVDNNCDQKTKRYLRSLKGINIITNKKNLGSAGGTNLALKRTSGEFLVLLDDDAQVAKGWLEGLFSHIINDKKVGIVGCKIVFPDKRIMSAECRIKPPHAVGYGEKDKGQRNYIRRCDAVIRTCWLMRRKLIGSIGYLDERFFPSQYEDIDYCIRARRAGYRIVYTGRVTVMHHHLFRLSGHYQKNKRRFLKKWARLFPECSLKGAHPSDICMTAGIEYFEKKKFKKALVQFKKAGALNRNFSDPVYTGISLFNTGKFNAAVREFKYALSLNQDDMIARYYLALSYRRTGFDRRWRREADHVLNSLHAGTNRGRTRHVQIAKDRKSSIAIEDFCDTITYYKQGPK